MSPVHLRHLVPSCLHESVKLSSYGDRHCEAVKDHTQPLMLHHMAHKVPLSRSAPPPSP